MSEDTEWPNNVSASPASRTVAINELQQPLAIATQTRVRSPGAGIELHFLRDADVEIWRAHAARLARSSAYAWVKLVRLKLQDEESGEELRL